MKIKKYLLPILILIMLVGLFTPKIQVSAQDMIDPNTGEVIPAPTDISPAVREATFGLSCDLGSNPKLQNLLVYATCIIGASVIPLIFAVAIAMFIFGVVQYVINTNDEAKKTKGRQFMIWGILALSVMVSVWGLVSILTKTFGIDTNFIPQVQSVGQGE